ncbi:MAG: hypothetical protein OXI90_02595 [Gammaproteobacteria bacterium]|nr:hypothetical protein [Gammaproteobacteria bacterium]
MALMTFLWPLVLFATLIPLVLLGEALEIEVPTAIGIIVFVLCLAIATLVTRLAYLKVVEEDQ